jgi:hypothetical protein
MVVEFGVSAGAQQHKGFARVVRVLEQECRGNDNLGVNQVRTISWRRFDRHDFKCSVSLRPWRPFFANFAVKSFFWLP